MSYTLRSFWKFISFQYDDSLSVMLAILGWVGAIALLLAVLS